MKLMLVAHGWPLENMGGVGLYVQGVAQAFHHLGHELTVLTPTISESYSLQSRPQPWGTLLQFHSKPAQRWSDTWKRTQFRAFLGAWLTQHQPDIIHIHHLSGLGLQLGEICASYSPKTRLIVTLHDYAIICPRGQLFQPNQGICSGPEPSKCAHCIAAQFQLNPISARIGRLLQRWPSTRARLRHQLDQSSVSQRSINRVAQRFRCAKRLFYLTDMVLSPSHDLQNRMQSMGFQRPHYCELPLLRPIHHLPAPQTVKTRFLFASTMIPTKGLHLLLSAFAKLDPQRVQLSIAGHSADYDGWPNYDQEVRAQIQHLPNVQWIGAVAHQEMPALLANHHHLVLPSMWPENSPIIIREAAAAGLGIICSSEGGAAELSPHALTVKSGDTTSLYEALQRLQAQQTRYPPVKSISMHEHAQKLIKLYSKTL